VFDDSTANDATTSWAGSKLIGTVWDSDQHDGQSTRWQVRIGTADVRIMMNMKLWTDQNTIEELSDSDDLMATDVAGITKV
jgi:hypothetical protein